MVEERRKILEMLQEGKITVDEAMSLLKQFPDINEKTNKTNKTKKTNSSGCEEGCEDCDLCGEENTDDYGYNYKYNYDVDWSGIGEEIRNGLRDVQNGLSEVFGEVFFNGKTPKGKPFNFVSTPVGNGIRTLKLLGKNAPIIIRHHDEDHIKVSGEYQSSKPNAEVSFRFDSGNAEIIYDYNLMRSVRIVCEVPQNVQIERVYAENKNSSIDVIGLTAQDVELITKNSKIQIDGLTCNNVLAKTRNANIYATGIISSEEISLETTNSKIDVKNITSANIVKLHTSNASVSLDLSENDLGNSDCERDLEIRTSNGSIRLDMPKTDYQVGYKIQATTSRGNIKCGFDNMNYETESKNYLVGKTTNYEQLASRLNVNLSTSNGSIHVK